MKRGLFITIYGINNIGKTHHATRLVKRLRNLGYDAIYVKYPVYNQKPTGPLLNKLLRKIDSPETTKGRGVSPERSEWRASEKICEEELQLWFVLNRYQFQPKLEKFLSEGKIVVAEDYTGTGIAWGTAKGANPHELELMNKFLVQENVAILMEGKRTLKAKEKGHIHEENDVLVARCAKVFQKLQKRFGWKLVKVSKDRDITAARIWHNIAPYLK